jgi:hypothetical protein
MGDHTEPLKLPDAVKYVFEECCMVLPGIQALFGFQMIAVFDSGFSQKLSPRCRSFTEWRFSSPCSRSRW